MNPDQLKAYLLSRNNKELNLIKQVDSSKRYDNLVIKSNVVVPKTGVNSYLLNRVNKDLRNEKLRQEHASDEIQSQDNGAANSENIKLTAQGMDIQSEYNSVMSPYLQNQNELDKLYLALDQYPNAIKEFVFNFQKYEPAIKQMRGKYVNDKIFEDKIIHLVLNNLNYGNAKTPTAVPVVPSNNPPNPPNNNPPNPPNDNPNNPNDNNPPIDNNNEPQEAIPYGNQMSQEEMKNDILQYFPRDTAGSCKLEQTEALKNKLHHLFIQMMIWIRTPSTYPKISDLLNKAIEENKDISSIYNYIQQLILNGNTNINEVTNDFNGLPREPFRKKIADYFNLTANPLSRLSNKDLADKFMAAHSLATLSRGSGLIPSHLKDTESMLRDSKKYFINHYKLGHGILDIRYAKNRHLTQIKPLMVGDGVKKIMIDYQSSGKLNNHEYQKLDDREKDIIKRVFHMLDKDHLLGNEDDNFNKRFEVLLGEIRAGNNSDLLKRELKKFILHAINISKLPRNLGYDLMNELEL